MVVLTTRSATTRPVSGAALVLLALSGVGSVQAQTDPEVSVNVAECLRLESPEQRFECYESRANEALESRDAAVADQAPDVSGAPSAARADGAAPEPDVTAASDSEPARENRSRDGSEARGRPESDQSRRSSRDDSATSAEDPGPDEIFATITALEETLPNSYVITLDNGQVWRQVRPKWYPLRPGLRVRIYPTRWGSSHRLQAVDGGGYIQVQRAR